ARQALSGYPELLVAGNGDVLSLRAHTMDLIRAADPTMLFGNDMSTLAGQIDPALLATREFGGLISVFAIAALALSIMGIYGVVAFGVARRTREIGIRIALGGTAGDVMRVVVRDGAKFVVAGLVLGLILSTGLGRLLRSYLFGVSPLDPVTYVGAAAVFGVV